MTSTAKLYGPPRVGADTLAFCTKCRMELAHVIVSMLDGRPAKVECKTCRGTHRYRTTGNEVPRASGRSRTTAPRTVIRAAELWEQKMAQKTKEDIAPYRTSQKYSTGDLVQHANFGVGIVEEVRSPNKIAVLFRDGEKVLVHGIGPATSS